jgi:PAS domain S-box-containing protein
MTDDDVPHTNDELTEELARLRAQLGEVRGQCALYQAAAEMTGDALYIKDREGRYVMINTAGARMLGKTVQEVIGRDDTAIFSEADARQVIAEDRKIIEDNIAHTHEQQLAARGGQARWYLTTKAPYRDDAGRLIGIAGISRDLTERKRAEETIEQGRRRLQALFDNALDAILFVNPDAQFVEANPAACALVGYTREELLQKTIWDLTPLENLPAGRELWQTFLASGSVSGEYTVVRKDGPARDLEFRAVANILPGLHLSISHDITERKRAREARQRYAERSSMLSRRVVDVQEQERRHLARELHDEIGQTLTAIGLNLQAVKGLCDLPAQPYLDDCIGVVDRAIQQVRNLSLDLRPSMLDDLGLAAALRWLVDRQAQRARLTVHFAAQSPEIAIPQDLATACFRIGQEAITNVIRHARARNLWVELQQGENELRLSIRDDGIGFDPTGLRHGATHGKSLGLLGMQERVELFGGQFGIESAPGGQGTRILVQFPIPPAPVSEELSVQGGSP